MELDDEYVAISLSSLSGLPVRLYRNEKFAGLYHHSKFKPDLAILEEEHIFQKSGNVSYYMDENFLYYGLLRAEHGAVALIIGPVTHNPVDRALAVRILRSMGESMHRAGELVNYFSSIPCCPLQNFLQILCTVSYFLNGEKLDVGGLLLEDDAAIVPQNDFSSKHTEQGVHNTLELEEQMLSYVEHGRVSELEELFRQPMAGRAGMMALDALRQQKNLLICSTTLVSRAAIRGGLDQETAFTLSDDYIQRAELLTGYVELTRLNTRMVLDFTQRVERAQCGAYGSDRVRAVRDYVLNHISRSVTTEELARLLGTNRTYLCKMFREETGGTVQEYVTDLKIGEARRLLDTTTKTAAEIGSYLGYSSQSHFQRIFKKAMGVTPREYRGKRNAAVWSRSGKQAASSCGPASPTGLSGSRQWRR